MAGNMFRMSDLAYDRYSSVLFARGVRYLDQAAWGGDSHSSNKEFMTVLDLGLKSPALRG